MVVELGSGPGNTAYPLTRSSENPQLYIHALDYSSTAIDLFRVRLSVICFPETDKSRAHLTAK